MSSSTIGLNAGAATAAAPYGRPHWWLAGMLLALHAGTAWGLEQPWARGFMLAHFGLFLLWQPLWRGERSVTPLHALLVVGAGVALAATAGWWTVSLWLALMFGLLGGRATGTTALRARIVLVLAAAYVLTLLLAWVVPHLFSAWRPEEALVPAVRYALPLLPLAICAVPLERDAPSPTAVVIDLFYAALLFLLVAVLVLGSFVLRDAVQGSYVQALMQMLLGVAAVLAALSWLWNPHAGYAGLQQLVSRYVAGIGLPFERWIARLATLAAEASGPAPFMQAALEATLRTSGVAGVSWRHGAVHHALGVPGKHTLGCAVRGQDYAFGLRAAPSPGMALHLRLLAETLACFYEAKLREQREREHAYERAVHETGARVTHDVKNVLQALRGLCAAAEEAQPGDDAALAALLKRQLPALAARMSETLTKLAAPAASGEAMLPVAAWWEGVQRRHAGRGVCFESGDVASQATLPAALFDGVVDNLVANALRKSDPPPAVRAAFGAAGAITLTVTDDGAAIPQDVATGLLHQRVSSRSGLGIGLYHCARHAERLGYRLTLACNQPGRVCFVLAPGDARPHRLDAP